MGSYEQENGVGSSGKGVRERLLDAAEELFSEHGFEGTSVRELASAAGCNLASVNYYYGGKENLYVELWRSHLSALRDTRLASIDAVVAEGTGNPSLEDLLRSFARSFVGSLMVEGRSHRLMKLMAREMIDPHLPAGMFGRDVIEPTLTAMHRALRKVCPELDDSKVPLVVFSLVGQLLHTIRMEPTLQLIDNREFLEMFEPARVLEHVVAFSAAGIRAYAEGKAQ